jgi:membrane protease YdiL (CAAX protease family)
VGFYSLLGQWALVLTIFWPVLRGMPFQRWRGELGWHRGQGFFKEVGAGLTAYLASLPIYFVAAVLVAIYIVMKSVLSGTDATPAAEDNKLLDLAMSGNPLLIVLIFLLATLWAPIVEESIFRGALYRQSRWLVSPVVAGLFTAFVFAIMHGYAVVQLFMVGVLGIVFALMREWRGSLIAPMTAHFTHNAVVMTFVIILFGQIGS